MVTFFECVEVGNEFRRGNSFWGSHFGLIGVSAAFKVEEVDHEFGSFDVFDFNLSAESYRIKNIVITSSVYLPLFVYQS